MENIENNIIERMEKALRKIHSCDQYLTHGTLNPQGKKNLAKSIIEYSQLSNLCDSNSREKIEKKYERIMEDYGLKCHKI